MKVIKVAEATQPQLDWLVARVVGDELPKSGGKGLDYSSDWAAGGPIIEREIHCLNWREILDDPAESYWVAEIDGVCQEYGHTPLIAAMRCYAVSKLGETAEVPEKLI